MNDKKPVIDVAREQDTPEDGIITLSTGVRARIVPVAAATVDEVTSRIPDPPVPVQMIEDKGREEPNPFDPNYQNELREAQNKRVTATLDAFVMFGVELIDEIPDDGEWIEKLEFMDKRGLLDLSAFNLKNKIEREFVYKRFIAVAAPDIQIVSAASGVSQQEVSLALESFRGSQEETEDQSSSSEEPVAPRSDVRSEV